MFLKVVRVWCDNGKNQRKKKRLLLSWSVTPGRPFCSVAPPTRTTSLLELSSTSAISHFLKACRYFQSKVVKDSVCSQSIFTRAGHLYFCPGPCCSRESRNTLLRIFSVQHTYWCYFQQSECFVFPLRLWNAVMVRNRSEMITVDDDPQVYQT